MFIFYSTLIRIRIREMLVVSEQKSMSKANKSKYNNCVIAPTNADVNERESLTLM